MRQKRHTIATASLLILCSVIGLVSAPIAHAQSNSANTANSGIRVTPAIMQVQLQPNQNSVNLNYSVSNLTNQAISIALGARDFGAVSQSGSITLYGTNYDPTTNVHGIQSYTSFPNSTITLPAQTTQQINVSIQNATKLAPGGHYGAILFSPQSALSTEGSNRVNLNASVAGLVFLTTAYGDTYGVNASMSHVGHVLFSMPKSVYLVFNNTGNTQTIPEGQLTLFGPHSNILGTQVVNTSSGLILSGGSRIFQTQLSIQQNNWYTLPGIYHLRLQYKDSSDTNFKTLNQTFLYINWKVVLLVLFEIALAIYIFKKYFWKFQKRFIYYRVKLRKLKSISKKQPTTQASSPTESKAVDAASTTPKKKSKKTT